MEWGEARAVRADVAKEAAKAACLQAQSRVERREQLRNGTTAAAVDEHQHTHRIAQRKKVKEVAIAAQQPHGSAKNTAGFCAGSNSEWQQQQPPGPHAFGPTAGHNNTNNGGIWQQAQQQWRASKSTASTTE